MTFLDKHRDSYGVESICSVLPIAPSTYYEQKARQADPDRLPCGGGSGGGAHCVQSQELPVARRQLWCPGGVVFALGRIRRRHVGDG